MPTILEAIDDPGLLGAWHENKPSWDPWRAFLAAQFALYASTAQQRLFSECTGRQTFPKSRPNETYLICGRRAGKTSIFSLIAVYTAVFNDWSPYLRPGQRGYILLLASDQAQAGEALENIRGIFEASHYLGDCVERQTSRTIDLKNGIRIGVKTANYRAARGYTVVAALLDEAAFLRGDGSANPDVEIINALRPAMLTIPDAMLICASSPFEKRRLVYDAFCRYHGQEDARVLVWKAPTQSMNPAVDQSKIDAAYTEDPIRARSEYGAEFRPDRSTALLTEKSVRACVLDGRGELPPNSNFTYVAFVDPSGGMHDSMTLAIAHWEDGVVAIDCVREWPSPLSPGEVVKEVAETMRRYWLYETTGDRYAAAFNKELFAQNGVTYEISSKTKSDLYLDILPRINSGMIKFPDDDTLIQQLLSLERKTMGGGREAIEHPRGQLDDVANAVAGVASLVREPIRMFMV